jgi:Ribbon-helix-helix protein, copG family
MTSMDDEKDSTDESGTVKFQCRLDRELAQIVDDWCEEHDRTRSWIIRRALIFIFAKEIGEKRIKKFFDKLKPINR